MFEEVARSQSLQSFGQGRGEFDRQVYVSWTKESLFLDNYLPGHHNSHRKGLADHQFD
jgi:hypothetical protein